MYRNPLGYLITVSPDIEIDDLARFHSRMLFKQYPRFVPISSYINKKISSHDFSIIPVILNNYKFNFDTSLFFIILIAQKPFEVKNFFS